MAAPPANSASRRMGSRVAGAAGGDGRAWARPTGGRAEGAEETTERGQERRAVAGHARLAGLPRAVALGQTARAVEAVAPRRAHAAGVGLAAEAEMGRRG